MHEMTLKHYNANYLSDRNSNHNAELIYRLFLRRPRQLCRQLYPKRFPVIPPEKYGKRHRNPFFKLMNDFRHWWKSSRLLVRMSGAVVYALVIFQWSTLVPKLIENKRKSVKSAVKVMKTIGRGGMNRPFLKGVQPGTRSLRIYMAIGRALEARVDNRFWEVLISEAFAFMGNRSIRWWTRELVDILCRVVVFPSVVKFVPVSICELFWPSIIFSMGLLRAILPFMSSFVGSRIGRQSTLKVSEIINYRWKAVQSSADFVLSAGTKRSTGCDNFLVRVTQRVAKAVGNGADSEVVRHALRDIGFRVYGSGIGGYSVYRNDSCSIFPKGTVLYLHITPLGPSLLNEMPRYVILEQMYHSRHEDRNSMILSRISALNGFIYSGSFFTPQEWASLKSRYIKELACYDNACKYIGSISRSVWALNNFSPPTDRSTLKAFLRTGRPPNKIMKDNRQWSGVMKSLDQVTEKLKYFDSQGKAPKGIIIYMEGLDCVGKSSTGGLIMKVLEASGYKMHIVHYNRPPSVKDLKHPWMWRFKRPFVAVDNKILKNALVWDRGPAGDFVYGDKRKLSQEDKLNHYVEFHKFEEECLDKGILFLKLFYVSDRDSISKTLGKRLAQKKIGHDLQNWLDANSLLHDRAGLEEIETHIDMTDFIAFNRYDQNLRNFHDFVMHTDHIGRLHHAEYKGKCVHNPWIIVSTHDRHLARLSIMKAFERHLNDYVNHCKFGDSRLISEFCPEQSNDTNSDKMWADEETPLRPKTHLGDAQDNTGSVMNASIESSWYALVMAFIFYTYFHFEWDLLADQD